MKALFLLLTLATSVTTDDENSTSCLLWHYHPSTNNQSCQCGASVNKAIICQEDDVYLRFDYAMGQRNNSTDILVARSQFVFHNFSSNHVMRRVYFLVDSNASMLNENICSGNNRRGFLCNECRPNYGPSGYSPKCVDCSDHSQLVACIFYITIKLVPIALIFFLIMMFRIDILQGPMMGYIIFCQILTVAVMRNNGSYQLAKHYMKKISVFMDISLSVSAIWTLDFQHIQQVIHPFCISDQLQYIDLRFFDILSALFPLFLVTLTYSVIGLHTRNIRVFVYCWKPFRFYFARVRRNWNVANSIIHAYTTLFILSFTLLNANGFEILRFTNVFDVTGNKTNTVLFFDPSPKRGSVYIFPVVFLLLILSVCPALVLLLYPIQCIRTKLQRLCSHRLVIAANTFIDVLQSPFKDGCNGTRDFRILPGLVACGVILFQVSCCVAPILFHDKGDYILPFLAASFGLLSVLCAYAKAVQIISCKSVTCLPLYVSGSDGNHSNTVDE